MHLLHIFSIFIELLSPFLNNSSAYRAYPHLIYKDASPVILKIYSLSEYYASTYQYFHAKGQIS